MKEKIKEWKTILLRNKYILRNTLLMFAVMTLLFSVYAVYTYQKSRQIMEEEFTSAGQQDLETIAGTVDNFIMDTRYMISTLVINDFVQFFFSSASSEDIFDSFSNRIQEQLLTLQYSNNAIEAIYLYSEASNTIYTANSHVSFDSFDDRDWFFSLSPDANGFSIFPYAMKGKFPYVICIAKELTVNGYHSAVTIMVNPSKLPILSETGQNDYQEAYMVSDENEVFYRFHQDDLLEPLSISEELGSYDSGASKQVALVPDRTEPYTFAQQHSSEYPWSYVLITHLEDYTERLSANRAVIYALSVSFLIFAVFFAVFISLRSFGPIRSIRNFLDNPELLTSHSTKDDSDIEYIAGRITQYIQTNRQLADELNRRLNLLNQTQMVALQTQINPHFLFNTLNMMHILATDSLGYDHALPQMILNLSALLRYALEPTEMVDLKTELSYTDLYLAILNQRYGETLNVVRQIEEATMNAQVPKLFIQPIIENAVFHGFSKKHDSECALTLTCAKQLMAEGSAQKEFIVFKISDNGIGMDENTLQNLREVLADKRVASGKSIGLRNVMQRMNLTYTDQCTMTIESTPNVGSCFTLIFPYVK